jgi:DNA-directed RNA polymerase subunit RPC12/RpoP
MSDIRFACPRCQQHIQAEPGYAGMEIACPACSAKMVVPGQPVIQMSALAPVPVPVPAAPQASSSAGGCPACGAPLARGTVLCTKCGYNLVTKQRLGAGQVAAAKRGKAGVGEEKWYATAYPYIGVVLVILAALYFLGKENASMQMAFLGVAALYYVVVQIMVLVAAFRHSVGTGFLTLCVPFYGVYFVLKVSESPALKALYASAIGVGLSLKFLRD